MAEKKQSQLDIRVGGSVDPSLAKAIGLSETEIRRLNKATSELNKIVGKRAYLR
jgi:hypothetical protein